MPGGLILGGFLMAAAVLASLPQVARADPHAVFYTAIGQRQLFFNVLAAINQADYVEPATGIFSREDLAVKRDTADQASSVSEALKTTRTDLAAVLTRLITLDGTDLWTNYLALQIAKEATQTTNTTAYIELLCAQGLGRKFSGAKEFCENNAPSGQALVDQKRAFVVDPGEREDLALRHGLDIVYSDKADTSDYQKRLNYLGDPEVRSKDIATDFPVPWDESIATLRKKARGDSLKEQAIARLSQAATGFHRPSYVDDSIYDLIEPTADGRVALKEVSEITNAADKIDLYMATVQGFTDLPQQFTNAANRGAAAAEQHLAATNAEGAIAPVEPSQANNGAGHNVDLAAPPYVNREQLASALQALGNANAAPQGVPPVADIKPGTQPILPDVAGVQDDQREGRVLHAATPSQEGRFELRDKGLDFSTNPAAIHEETGGKHLLLALTDGSKDRSGCGCGVATVLNDLGQDVLAKINGWGL